jgi:hypothetical protein
VEPHCLARPVGQVEVVPEETLVVATDDQVVAIGWMSNEEVASPSAWGLFFCRSSPIGGIQTAIWAFPSISVSPCVRDAATRLL